MKEEAQAEKNGEATIGRKQKGKLQENCEKLTPIGARTRGHERAYTLSTVAQVWSRSWERALQIHAAGAAAELLRENVPLQRGDRSVPRSLRPLRQG